MQGHSKEHLANIGDALTTAAKSFGALMSDLVRPANPRANSVDAHTKLAVIAPVEPCAGDLGSEYRARLQVDLFIKVYGARAEANGPESTYGYQSPDLVASFIQMQTGAKVYGWNAKELAASPRMAARYDWLPATTQAKIGDIAVYDGPGYGTVGVVAELTPRHRRPMVYTQGNFSPRVVNLSHMQLLGYHRAKQPHG